MTWTVRASVSTLTVDIALGKDPAINVVATDVAVVELVDASASSRTAAIAAELAIDCF